MGKLFTGRFGDGRSFAGFQPDLLENGINRRVVFAVFHHVHGEAVDDVLGVLDVDQLRLEFAELAEAHFTDHGQEKNAEGREAQRAGQESYDRIFLHNSGRTISGSIALSNGFLKPAEGEQDRRAPPASHPKFA
jgi:hypothetical protein